MRPALRAEARPRDVWAWAMYDFANSGYTTVVVTALFNAYFVAVVAGGAPWATLAWTGALAVSYLAILVTVPSRTQRRLVVTYSTPGGKWRTPCAQQRYFPISRVSCWPRSSTRPA